MSVFLRDGRGLIAMRETEYEAESVLQELLADHPELVAGDAADDASRGWLLVRREAGVGVSEGAQGRLDHLFLDEDGVPTLVEVKRSSDTRLRREVVGQMLDYAANAWVHWTMETLRSWFEGECDERGDDPDGTIEESFPEVEDAATYWEAVHTNLTAGKLRLVFVSDSIPPELRSIIEFLNRQMTETEVIAIEVKQYVDADGQRQTIVPRIIGQSEAARQVKRRPVKRTWTRQSILDVLEERRGPTEAEVARRIFEWAEQSDELVWWFGSGKKDGSFQAGLDDGSVYLWPFALYTYGRIELQFQYIGRRPPFDRREAREELRARLNAISGVRIADGALDARPAVPLAALADEAALATFLSVMEWAFDQATAVGQGE